MPMMKIGWLFQPGFVARRTEEEKDQRLRKRLVLQLSAKRGILCRWFQETAMCLGSRIWGADVKGLPPLNGSHWIGKMEKALCEGNCI
jgi:hypothetical protein